MLPGFKCINQYSRALITISDFFEPTGLLHFKEQLAPSHIVGVVESTHDLVLTLEYLLLDCFEFFLKQHLSLDGSLQLVDFFAPVLDLLP